MITDSSHGYGDGFSKETTSKTMHQNSGDALKGDKRGGLRRKHKVQVAFT
jgi:hypothetical protein